MVPICIGLTPLQKATPWSVVQSQAIILLWSDRGSRPMRELGRSGKRHYAPANPADLSIRTAAGYREFIERKRTLVGGVDLNQRPPAPSSATAHEAGALTLAIAQNRIV